MSSSALMAQARAFLRSRSLDEDTLSYLCEALGDCDSDRSELREFLEPFLSAADISSLLGMVAMSPRRHAEAAPRLDLALRILPEAAALSGSLSEASPCEAEAAAGAPTGRSERAFGGDSAAWGRASLLGAEDAIHDVEGQDLGARTDLQKADSIRKGDHVVIKAQPCKVMQISTSKIWKGPHKGCFQTQLVARDIFTGRKFEHTCPAWQKISMPLVNRREYQVVDVGDDGELSLLTPMGDMRIDVNLPTGTDADKQISQRIQTDVNIGKTVFATVASACGTEKVVAVRSMCDAEKVTVQSVCGSVIVTVQSVGCAD